MDWIGADPDQTVHNMILELHLSRVESNLLSERTKYVRVQMDKKHFQHSIDIDIKFINFTMKKKD